MRPPIRPIYVPHVSEEYAIGAPSAKFEDIPEADLVLQEELHAYFEDMQEHQPNRYVTAHAIHAHLHPSQNKVDQLRTIVAIPVACGQENRTLARTLECYSTQTMSPKDYEIILNVNAVHGDSNPSWNQTLQIIEDHRSRFPEHTVRYTALTYDSVVMGAIRSDLWDAIGLDMLRRNRQEDILVVSGDADTTYLNLGYLEKMAEKMKHPSRIITSRLRWLPVDGLGRDALPNRVIRYFSFLGDILNRDSTVPLVSDACTGFSLASYYAIGGFDRNVSCAETDHLTQRIARCYLRRSRPLAYVPSAVTGTSSRRLAQSMILGHKPFDAWEVTNFEKESTIRTDGVDLAKLISTTEANYREWIDTASSLYLAHLPEAKRNRIINAAQQILQLTLGS